MLIKTFEGRIACLFACCLFPCSFGLANTLPVLLYGTTDRFFVRTVHDGLPATARTVFKPLIPSSMYRFTQAFTNTKLMSVRQPWRLKDHRPSAEQRGNAYGNNASRLSEIHFRVRGVAPPSTPILLAFPYLTIEREYLIFI